jgi:hypothetical protein
MQERPCLLFVFHRVVSNSNRESRRSPMSPTVNPRLRLRRKENIMATTIKSLGSMLDDEWKMELETLRILDRAGVDFAGRSDCTLIQTEHSIYLFLEHTPAERSGLLVGGAVGEKPTAAYLVGSMDLATGEADYPTCLRAGERAIFQIMSQGVCKRIITSPVVNVVHRQVRATQSNATRKEPFLQDSCETV